MELMVEAFQQLTYKAKRANIPKKHGLKFWNIGDPCDKIRLSLICLRIGGIDRFLSHLERKGPNIQKFRLPR